MAAQEKHEEQGALRALRGGKQKFALFEVKCQKHYEK